MANFQLEIFQKETTSADSVSQLHRCSIAQTWKMHGATLAIEETEKKNGEATKVRIYGAVIG